MTTETTTTARIRWEENQYGNFLGYVGTLSHWMFRLDRPVLAGQRWTLTAVPTWLADVKGGTPDELKAEAEHWLEEFASSLGAVFPAQDLTRDQLIEALERYVKNPRTVPSGAPADDQETAPEAAGQQETTDG